MLRLFHPQSYLLLYVEKKGEETRDRNGKYTPLKEEKRIKSVARIYVAGNAESMHMILSCIVRITLRISRLVSRLKLFLFFFNTICNAFD